MREWAEEADALSKSHARMTSQDLQGASCAWWEDTRRNPSYPCHGAPRLAPTIQLQFQMLYDAATSRIPPILQGTKLHGVEIIPLTLSPEFCISYNSKCFMSV